MLASLRPEGTSRPGTRCPGLPKSSPGRAALTRSDELDEMSLADTAVVDLDLHCQDSRLDGRGRSRSIVWALPVDLALRSWNASGSAARHRQGRSPRFQRWLDPEENHAGIMVAKSKMPRHLWSDARVAAGWPAGGRHEELSARLVRRWLELRPSSCNSGPQDLLLHLIISHHGSGRPLLPPVEDATGAVLAEIVEEASVEVPADLALVDWDQPARFRRLCDRFGPWGLALLEAILRQSDHAISAGSDVGHAEVR